MPVKHPARFVFCLLLCLLTVRPVVFSGRVFAAEKRAAIPFQPDDDLEAVRRKIRLNGYHFTVGRNWVVALPGPQRERMRSRRPPLRARSRADLATVDPGPVAAFRGTSLPASFDWRDRNGRSYIGPVHNQGDCGSCYAFGACAAAEGSYNLAAGLYNFACIDFSEAFISFCLDDLYDGFEGCVGSDYDYQELDALVAHGVCLESAFPYSPEVHECRLQPSPRFFRFRAWYRVPCGDIELIKAAIYHFGVVDAAVLTNRAFDAYQSGIYEDTKVECRAEPCFYAETDHVISLVGWNDNQGEGYWILRNSWGRSWGEEGYMRIKYRAAHVACAVCYLVPEMPEEVPIDQPPGVAGWLPLLLGR